MAHDRLPKEGLKHLSVLRDEMNRAWDRFMAERSAPVLFRGQWSPSVDVSETKTDIIVRAEFPGMDVGDIDIAMTNDVLTMEGEKKPQDVGKDEHFHRIERRGGAFSRSIQLPASVQIDKVKATHKNGVLTVTMTKSEEAKATQIKINAE